MAAVQATAAWPADTPVAHAALALTPPLQITSEGGGAIAGVDPEDDGDEDVEKKLDQFWSFPDIENEITFDSKKDFEEQYWQFFQDGFVKLAKHKKVFASKDEFKEAGARFKAAKKWVKKNFKSLQFFTTESYITEVEEHDFDGKFVGDMFAANIAYVLYDETTGEPTFYFVKDAFESQTF